MTTLPTTALPVGEILTAFPDTGLFVDESSVTTTVVPIAPSGAGLEAVTVDWAAETVSVPKVAEAVFVITVLVVVSFAVNVTVSSAASVAVNVATPEASVAFGVVGYDHGAPGSSRP